jgi:hypothetical protein
MRLKIPSPKPFTEGSATNNPHSYEIAEPREIAHANLVKYHRWLVSQNMKLFSHDVTIDINDIEREISKIEVILLSPTPTVEEALKIAISIESGAAEVHYLTAIAKTGERWNRWLRSAVISSGVPMIIGIFLPLLNVISWQEELLLSDRIELGNV